MGLERESNHIRHRHFTDRKQQYTTVLASILSIPCNAKPNSLDSPGIIYSPALVAPPQNRLEMLLEASQ
jgi:hypothetical protein